MKDFCILFAINLFSSFIPEFIRNLGPNFCFLRLCGVDTFPFTHSNSDTHKADIKIIPSQMEVAPLHCTVDITQKRSLSKTTKEIENM